MRGQYMVETEPGILAILTACGGPPHPPQRPPQGAIMAYIGHDSGERDLAAVPEAKALLQDLTPVVAIDPRGIGQSKAQTCGLHDLQESYGADFLYAATSDMLGQPYAGRRVHDVLRSLDMLFSEGATDIELIGRGLGSVTAAFAGLLHPRKPRVRLIHYLPNYEAIVRAPSCAWPFSVIPRGVLAFFDLPDVYRALGKRLTLERPWNIHMRSGTGNPPKKGMQNR